MARSRARHLHLVTDDAPSGNAHDDDTLTYTNRLGATYFLHEGKTKTGKPRFFVAKTARAGVLATMPEGYEFSESINGVVSVRRIHTTKDSIPAKDIELIQAELSRHRHVQFHRVEGRKGEIVIHEPVGTLTDNHFNEVAQTAMIPPFLAQRLAESRRTKARYAPVMKFEPDVHAKGTYIVYRMAYRGEGGWHLLSAGSLGKLASRYVWPIGTDEFFELV